MKHIVTTFTFVVGAAALAACASGEDQASQSTADVTAVAGRYLVVFKSDTLPADALAKITRAGGTVSRAIDEVGVVAVSGTNAFAAKIAKDSAVAAVGPEHFYAQPDVTVIEANEDELVASAEGAPTAADNLYGYQWDMRRIGAPAVWPRLPLATTRTRVAVLDTGVKDDHSDLVGQVCETVSTAYCSTSGGAFNSPSYPKYATLIDFDAHPSWSPSDGCTAAPVVYAAHGTHVAGTIAAKFGGGRVVGVAPDACVGAFKVFDRYRYTDDAGTVHDAEGAFDTPLYSAIVQAANEGYPVISMSLGSVVQRGDRDGNASWLAWNRVARYANQKGTLVVASAGNDGLDLNGQVAHVPSDLPTVVSTSATGSSNLVLSAAGYNAAPGSDVLAFYSDFGASVDLAAPGGDCGPGYPDTCPAQYLILNDYIFETGANAGASGYAFFAGTSMATPHVSAVAAQVRAQHPTWGPGDVRSFLKEHAEDLGSRQDFGHGLVRDDLATQ